MRQMCVLAFALLVLSAPAAHSAEIVRLNADNWHLVPKGKEVDAIHGDYLLRNDRLVAVVADTAEGRNANLTARNVQGAVLDLTLLDHNNDQLTAFFPNGEAPGVAATSAEVVTARGPAVTLRVVRAARPELPVEAVTDYTLRDGESFLRIDTRHRNTGSSAVVMRLGDRVRCDQTFTQQPRGGYPVVSFFDRWFRAAYAVTRDRGAVFTDGVAGNMQGSWLDYPEFVDNMTARTTRLSPGREIRLSRYLIPGRHQGEVELAARSLNAQAGPKLVVSVRTGGEPLERAEIVVRSPAREITAGYTDRRGRAEFALQPGRYTVLVGEIGRRMKQTDLDVSGDLDLPVELGRLSAVSFDVKDGEGRESPCKVQFIGTGGTPSPDLGPKQRAQGCGNLWFSGKGRFEVPLPPGQYRVILSRGPEYDAAYKEIKLDEGQKLRISARLPRVVNTRGWVATDFHNHSTESGDNTTETESRILCLVAEGLEFAPSTEHNRIQTYRHRLRALGLERLLATSDGLELTGSPLPLNHQNAFPLRLIPGAQSGGAPLTDTDPRAQIKRLYEHDAGAEKLVQQNHPDIGWLVYDRDGDGKPDSGFGTLEFTHAIEIWVTDILAMRPTTTNQGVVRNNRIFNWLQLLNQGHRLPGVANTDAHYCFHESGVIRNYIRSSTDDTAKISEMEMVRESKAGRVVMTNGPFLQVTLQDGLPGDEVRLRGGKGSLRVRVQCPNWFDVDRIQVLVNGLPVPELNFTRESHSGWFGTGVMKFDRSIPLDLKTDAHIIVVAKGEKSTTAPVMGETGQLPTAISNPIYVDVDGNGFTANKDTLGAPLPVKRSP